MWRQNIEQAEEERKRHTAIIEEYKKVQTSFIQFKFPSRATIDSELYFLVDLYSNG